MNELQLEKEYIITEEIAELIDDAINPKKNVECNDCTYEGAGFKLAVLEQVRSHPYSEQAIRQDEREKVLTGIFNWIDHHPYSIRKDGYEYYRVSRSGFAEMISKLRQQQEREP